MTAIIKQIMVDRLILGTHYKIIIMKFTLFLMLLGLTVLGCKKETKIETTKTSDSIIIDTMPADTVAAPMPADTLRTGTAGTQKMDTAKVIKK
jgi:hypothetical protein